jgi:hypothetical protein
MILLLLWLLLVVVTSQVRAGEVGKRNDFMWDQVYSTYLERSNYLHEVDSGRAERNAEMDKSLWIQIDLLCSAWGRTAKQCFYMMLYTTGNEFTPYKWF